MTKVVPQELATEILSCLPVKSLLRFKCACSSWNHLINSPSFANLHLTMAAAAALNLKGNDNCTFLTESSKPGFSLVSGDTFHLIREVTLPYFGEYGFRASGPCNGLFCLIGKKCPMESGNLGAVYSDDIALWNPGTGKLAILPHSPTPGREKYQVINFGFGAIGSDSDFDYKVVKIVKRRGELILGSSIRRMKIVRAVYYYAYVYSSMKNCWTEVNAPPPRTAAVSSECSVYHNGSYYWFSLIAGSNHLLSFDMHSHVFQVSQLPSGSWIANFNDFPNDIVMRSINEAFPAPGLTLYHYNHGTTLGTHGWYEILVRRSRAGEYFSMHSRHSSHRSRVDEYFFMHTRFSINGPAMGHDELDLVSYDLETQVQMRIRVYYRDRVARFIIVPFMESLVSINTGELLPEESLGKKSMPGIGELGLGFEEDEEMTGNFHIL